MNSKLIWKIISYWESTSFIFKNNYWKMIWQFSSAVFCQLIWGRKGKNKERNFEVKWEAQPIRSWKCGQEKVFKQIQFLHGCEFSQLSTVTGKTKTKSVGQTLIRWWVLLMYGMTQKISFPFFFFCPLVPFGPWDFIIAECFVNERYFFVSLYCE